MRHLIVGTLAIAGVTILGFAVVYFGSERVLRDVETGPPFEATIPTDAAVVAHGQHIARTRGCFGCHGKQLQGHVFDEWPWSVRSVAPNLTVFAREHDVAVLEAAIRRGIGHDGRALWSMPSYNWVHLSDDDLVALLAFLRATEVVENELPRPVLGWQARWQILTGKADHMAGWVADVPPLRLGPGDEPALARGEYLAMTTCNECHGHDLRGVRQDFGTTPDLAIVAAYTSEAFRNLMKNGVSTGGRDDLGLMTLVAEERFTWFTDQELDDLHAFLQSLAQVPVPQNVRWRTAN